MKTETLNVSGMTCNGCAAKVTRALSSRVGVAKVDVSLAKKTAAVTFDEGLTSVADLRGAVRSAGYDLTTTSPAVSMSGCSCGT